MSNNVAKVIRQRIRKGEETIYLLCTIPWAVLFFTTLSFREGTLLWLALCLPWAVCTTLFSATHWQRPKRILRILPSALAVLFPYVLVNWIFLLWSIKSFAP